MIGRIRAFLRATEDSVCDEARPTAHGTALITLSLPAVWQLNALRVEHGDAPAREVAAQAEELQAGLLHRKLLVPDENLGERLAPELNGMGWKATLLVVMALRRAADRPPVRGGGEEVDRRAGAAALAAFRAEQQYEEHPDALAQLEEMDERFSRLVGARDFAAPPHRNDGCCRLFVRDGIGQVDQVGTLAAARNRGYARAAVQAAVAAAGAERLDPVFLVADAEDWPRGFYERLGFDPVGGRMEFLRFASGATPP